MDFLELAKQRYSVRKLKSDPLDDGQIAKILEAARVAPTACNNQPQKITVVKSAEGIEKIKKCTDCHFGAPVVFIISYDKRLCWQGKTRNSGDIDCSIITTQMTLEAANLGLGSTIVLRYDEQKLREEFSLDENTVPVVLLPVGYPDDSAKPAPLHFQYRDDSETVEYK